MQHDLHALGVRPDQHPAVRVRMGLKATKGYGVTHKDRFHLAEYRANGSGMEARSVPHPSYAAFNALHPPELARAHERGESVDEQEAANLQAAHNQKRRELRGTLIHGEFHAPARTEGGCAFTRFAAHQLPGQGANPFRRPACTGDGHVAQRWNPKSATFEEIACAGDRCEFRQEVTIQGRPVTPCARVTTLLFQLRWPATTPFPALPAMIEVKGPVSVATMQWWGFYAAICEQWKQLGGQGEPNVYGLPIRIGLVRRTFQTRKSEVWVPEIHPDLPDGQTLQSFLVWRAQQLAEARPLLSSEGRPLLALPGAREVVEADYEDVPVERPAP